MLRFLFWGKPLYIDMKYPAVSGSGEAGMQSLGFGNPKLEP